jgi:acid phosphatase (class A)
VTRLRIAFFAFGFAAAGFAALGAGAEEMGGVPEIGQGLLKGYLQKEAVPDSAALLPPPPALGSAAEALDHEIARENLALRGTSRWKLASMDADLRFPSAAGDFSCAFIGAATVARLHDEPEFLADLEAAKSELTAARAKSLPPQNDCKFEAEALGETPPQSP